MGKPPTREIAGLLWTYDGIEGEWATPCGLRAWRCRDGRFTGGEADGYHPTLTAACEAEVAHREAMKAIPTVTPANDTAIEDWPAAQSASPTLEPGELDRMLGDPPPILPDPVAQDAEEREAQRRDTRAYYRNVAGWAFAALVLVALCSGVMRG